MEIKFSAKETKNNMIDTEKGFHINYLYLVAIADQHPELWRQFKNVVGMVDNKLKEMKQK